MIYDRLGAHALRHRFLEHFVASTGFSFVAMGFYDCRRKEVIEAWSVRQDDCSSKGCEDIPQDIQRALAVQAALHLGRSQETAAGYPLWIKTGAFMLGLGRPMADIFPVMVVPEDGWSDETRLQAMLRIGMAYVQQQQTEAVYSRSPWPEGLAAATLEMLSLRFLVVDEKAEVLRDGRIEDEIAPDDPEWLVLNGRLTLNDRKQRGLLHEAISKATGEDRRTSIITVSTLSGGVRLAIVAPLANSEPPLAMVLFEHTRTDHAVLRKHFFVAHGLTPSEQRIAHVILDGGTLSEAAELTSLSLATVRSYLKSIFNRTGTHRQSELITLYYRSILPVGTSILKAGAESVQSETVRPIRSFLA
jgi:DNA-binding CsgD family transcriptional regulator